MFIKYDVHVEHPVRDCREALLGPPEEWLPASVTGAGGGRRFLTRVGFGPGVAHLSKQVELVVDEPAAQGDWLVTHIHWRATGPSELFPEMDGSLRLEPVDPGSSRLSLGGNYEPPLGGLGKEIDAVMMHNVAEATVRDFVDGVARRLTERLAPAPPGS